MHLADYDGSLRQERDRRNRKANIQALLFGIVFGGLMLLTVAAGFITASLVRGGN